MPATHRPRSGLALLFLCVFGAALVAAQTPDRTRTFTQAELFQPTKTWTAHLSLASDQWRAMQPHAAQAVGHGDDWLQSTTGGRNGYGAIAGVAFDYVHADLEFDGVRFPDVALRFKGNGTFVNARNGKAPLKIDLNKFVKGQKIAGLSTLNFHNNVEDAGFMNEVVAYRLYRDAGIPAPRSSYVKVYLSVTGEMTRKYMGLYSIAENVDTNFLDARFGAGTGAILKPSTRNPFLDRGLDWAKYQQTYDPKTDITDAEKRRVIEFCQFVSKASDTEFAARVGEFLDLDEFARYFAAVVWLGDLDSILDRGQNYYVHLPTPTSKMVFIPWDPDHAFGNWSRVVSGRYDTLSITPPWGGPGVKFLSRMHAVPAFRTAYRDRLREFSQTVFHADRVASLVSELATAIRPAVTGEPGLVAGFERTAAGQSGLVPFTTARNRSVLAQLAK